MPSRLEQPHQAKNELSADKIQSFFETNMQKLVDEGKATPQDFQKEITAMKQAAENQLSEKELIKLGKNLLRMYEQTTSTVEQIPQSEPEQPVEDATPLAEEPQLDTESKQDTIDTATEELLSLVEETETPTEPEAPSITPPTEQQKPSSRLIGFLGRLGKRLQPYADKIRRTQSPEPAVEPKPQLKESFKDQYSESYANAKAELEDIFDDLTELGLESEVGYSQFVKKESEDVKRIDRELAEAGYIIAGHTDTVPTEFLGAVFKSDTNTDLYQYRLSALPKERLEDMANEYEVNTPEKFEAEQALREDLTNLIGETTAYEFVMNPIPNKDGLFINASEQFFEDIKNTLMEAGYAFHAYTGSKADNHETGNAENVNEDQYFQVIELDDGRLFIEVHNIQ